MGYPEDRNLRRMYSDLAWTWQVFSDPEEYVDGANKIRNWFQANTAGPVRSVLHLGCGGGHLDLALKHHFDLLGIDLSEEMISLARALNPEIRYRVGDMRDVRLGETFDAVLIADSISYMLSEEDLRAALETAYAHLRQGGCFVTYAESLRETFIQNVTNCYSRSRDEVQISFTENYFDPDHEDSTYEATFIFLIRRRGELEVEVDRHVLGLFDLDTWKRSLKVAGFTLVTTAETPEAVYFVSRRE
jgi:SAM-dependent methyltransferase